MSKYVKYSKWQSVSEKNHKSLLFHLAMKCREKGNIQVMGIIIAQSVTKKPKQVMELGMRHFRALRMFKW